MRRLPVRPAAALALLLAAGPVDLAAQFPPDSLVNLKVLPKDTDPRELVRIMAGFTRALGVRCTFCHVGEEGQPLATYDFPSDEKEMKGKARVMLHMVQHINEEHLAELDERIEPPLRVECATCHRGVREPRMLQDVLLTAHRAGGLDSALAAYRALRERYYGRAAYDFGEVPLADAAEELDRTGRLEDAVVLGALNVEMNPDSRFAKFEHAGAAVTLAFRGGTERGVARYRALRGEYGAAGFPEFLMNQVGYRLLREQRAAAAVEAFTLNVEAYPQSANTYDSLGEGYAALGDVERAIASYEKSLELNPRNANAVRMLEQLRRRR